MLRPGPDVNDVIAYCLAEAAARHKIELIAWLVMSDHYHAVVRDPEGQLPQFLEQFHKMVARVLNAKWERNENFWSSEETSVVYLPTPEDVFDKVVYVLSNPVADHLVETLEEWPGCSAQSNLGGKSTTHARPRFFFRENGTMPATATLTAVCPAEIRRNESVDAWTARVRAAVAERAEHLRAYRMREKIPILGRRRVLDAKHTDRAKKPEPFRGLKPCIACKDIARRIAELQALKHFRQAHERARVRFAAGDHKVEFPAGTYRMRAWGARCEPYPALAA
jgi:REP element-mobilizing transposase RayT